MFRMHLNTPDDTGTEPSVCELGKEPLTIGRGEDADWVIDDPDRQLSRKHIEMTGAGSLVRLKTLGRNGVRLEPDGVLVPQGETAVLGDGDVLTIGNISIRIERVARDRGTATPEDPLSASRLFEAFLAGAGIDSSAFAVEDPETVMARAGSIYREAVNGLCEMMADRNQLKEQIAVDRTRIRGSDNNPLRWAANRRVALDLLRSAEPGFLDGTEAVRTSFHSLQSHSKASMSGFQSAVRALSEHLSPEQVASEGETKGGFLRNEAANKWKAFEKLHAETVAHLDRQEIPLLRAFAEGYQRVSDTKDRDD